MSNAARDSTSSRWPELATLRALARDAAEQLQLPRVSGGVSTSASASGREPSTRQPAGRRGREDHIHGHGKNAKVMHLLLWGPK